MRGRMPRLLSPGRTAHARAERRRGIVGRYGRRPPPEVNVPADGAAPDLLRSINCEARSTALASAPESRGTRAFGMVERAG
jgi:hypothetical protein